MHSEIGLLKPRPISDPIKADRNWQELSECIAVGGFGQKKGVLTNYLHCKRQFPWVWFISYQLKTMLSMPSDNRKINFNLNIVRKTSKVPLSAVEFKKPIKR